MGNENQNLNLNLNINGQVQKIELTKGMNLESIQNEKVKRILSVFDCNKDGVLQDEDINAASVFTRGTFTTPETSRIVDYYETDENKNVNYCASWYHDDEGDLVVSTRDDDGDGHVDRAMVPYDKERETDSIISFDNNKDFDSATFINKEGDTVVVGRDKNMPVERIVNVEEGVNDYLTHQIVMGHVSNGANGKVASVDSDLDGKPDVSNLIE